MKIIVDTQEEKDNLLKESKYIHDWGFDLRGGRRSNPKYKLISLNSDHANILMHIYMNPEMIEVKNEIKNTG